jgi:hypothetical protein
VDGQLDGVAVIALGLVIFIGYYSPSSHFLQFSSVPRWLLRPSLVSTHGLVVIGG